RTGDERADRSHGASSARVVRACRSRLAIAARVVRACRSGLAIAARVVRGCRSRLAIAARVVRACRSRLASTAGHPRHEPFSSSYTMTTIFGVPTQALFGQLLIGLINGSFYAMLSL